LEIRSLGRYEIRAELGRGTMGIVYRGYDPVLDREIALKTVALPLGLEPERRKKFLDRFFLEAKIAGRLIHSNIVVTHDAATDDKTKIPFIAMELLLGESLQKRLERGRLEWKEALALVEPLAWALDYAHQAGVVHRDIKPANVLLTAKGVPKIADFGIAKLPNMHLTQSGKVMGTPYFMSPEQLEGGDVDGRSDVFSLGALLYNLLTGQPPFHGDDLASITQQVLYKSPTPTSETIRGIPEEVDGVLARAMAKERGERYYSAELADEIARLRQGEPPLGPLSFGEKTVESNLATLAPELVSEPVTSSNETSASGCLVPFLLIVAMTAGVFYRWEDVRGFFEPILERHEESNRRESVKEQAADALAKARERFESADFVAAEELVEEALELSRNARDGDGEALALLWRGRAHAERGAWSEARADLDAAASVYRIYGFPRGEAAAVAALADLERDLGRFDVASSLYDRASAAVDTRFDRAVMALMQGDLDGAEKGFEGAGAWAQAGAVALARGDTAAAEKAWSKAAPSPELDRFRGYAAFIAGDHEEAERLLDGDLEEPRSAVDGDEGPGLLRLMFRTEPSTPRSEERQRRLP